MAAPTTVGGCRSALRPQKGPWKTPPPHLLVPSFKCLFLSAVGQVLLGMALGRGRNEREEVLLSLRSKFQGPRQELMGSHLALL